MEVSVVVFLLLLLLLLLLYLYLTSFFLMLQAGGRRSVKQKAQAFTSGQSRSRPDSGTVEGCARQPRCTKNPRGFCEHSCAAMLERLYLLAPSRPPTSTSRTTTTATRAITTGTVAGNI